MDLKCRFYASRFPAVDDVVKVCVHTVGEISADVNLLEYNNINGMILMSELTRRRIRSINKLIRVGRTECVQVIRVDKEKGYIDLSKRRVSEEEAIKCEERYLKAKTVNSILCNTAKLLNYETDQQLEDLCSRTAWDFNRKYKSSAAAYDIFQYAVSNPEVLDECGLDDTTKELLLTNIKQRLAHKAVKFRADIELACTAYEGIDAIKKALKKGLGHSTEEVPIKIILFASPLFVVSTQTMDRDAGLSALTKVLDVIKNSIQEDGGMFNVQKEPRQVSDVDEVDLARKLQRLEDGPNDDSSDETDDSDGDDSETDDV